MLRKKNRKNRKLLALSIVGVLLVATSTSVANASFTCLGEEFTPKYLPEPTLVSDPAHPSTQYVGFPVKDSGKLLAMDCDLQRAYNKISLLEGEIEELQKVLENKDKQISEYKDRTDSLYAQVESMSTTITELQNEKDIETVKSGGDVGLWAAILTGVIGLLIGAGGGALAATIAK